MQSVLNFEWFNAFTNRLYALQPIIVFELNSTLELSKSIVRFQPASIKTADGFEFFIFAHLYSLACIIGLPPNEGFTLA
jgi:hypothetical protein